MLSEKSGQRVTSQILPRVFCLLKQLRGKPQNDHLPGRERLSKKKEPRFEHKKKTLKNRAVIPHRPLKKSGTNVQESNLKTGGQGRAKMERKRTRPSQDVFQKKRHINSRESYNLPRGRSHLGRVGVKRGRVKNQGKGIKKKQLGKKFL